MLLAVLILIIGMIKPKWILIWMDSPSRMIVVAISMVFFMMGSVMFGEGTKAKKLALEKEAAAKALATPAQPGKPGAEADKPKPAPVAPPPAQAPGTSANELRP